ncbi:DAK2 domain-containing protein [Paractinoplanes toevensis]|uniref:Dihydroxyacetone kinase n=1 Tax=Paractinoplanes toevensis TaxID=571911 RepID=A0A919W6S1_9ACTN|nr:DAK2 domain-containing protein [Actinoplanes toevensis]GIM95180.1 dihydroxyacetone kinase [Actinoplanes toevensis]
MLKTLDAAAVHRWCGGGLKALRAHQHEIDELNVYPVPDGDTGTNLVLTLTSAQQALDEPNSADELHPALRSGGDASVRSGSEAEARPGDAAAHHRDDEAGGRPGDGARSGGETWARPGAENDGFGGEAEGRFAQGGVGERSHALTGEVFESAAGDKEPGRTLRRMARGALLGARGNSGVIVSQILRGMADSMATSVAVRGGELARALRSATEAAYAAVARPVEGTVLSVVAAAAEGAGRIKSDDLVAVARAAAVAASEALARTPQQLPILARAGVVDAGGRGLCLLLDALVEALTPADPPHLGDAETSPADLAESDRGGAVPLALGDLSATVGGGDSDGLGAADDRPSAAAGAGGSAESSGGELLGAAEGGSGGELLGAAEGGGGFGFEVQYLLEAPDSAVGELRRVLDGLGDSLVVVGTGDGTWNVHVHVGAEDIGAAVEAGVVAGRPRRISVTPLEQARGHGAVVAEERPALRRGAVVVAAGDGLAALFEHEGATVVDRNPSIREMLKAIAATRAGCVVLLPNDANTHAVATAAAREAEGSGVRVSVVPTRSPVQALAALAVRDAGRPFSDDVIAMAEAAGACRYGEVCTAQRDSLTVAGPCRAGDLLGLVDGEVHVIGADLEDVSRRLLDRMLGGGGELATLVLGADAPISLEETLRGHVTQTWPFVELQCYAGGQPRYHLLVGVE